jgi:hypothetical protein
MRKTAFAISVAAGFCLAGLAIAPGQAQAGQAQVREYGYEVPSNVSHDVCRRRLNRGQECLYPYWYPFWSPDLAYRRPFKSFHLWPYWPYWDLW